MSQSSITLHNILGKLFVCLLGRKNDMRQSQYILFDAPPFGPFAFDIFPEGHQQASILLSSRPQCHAFPCSPISPYPGSSCSCASKCRSSIDSNSHI